MLARERVLIDFLLYGPVEPSRLRFVKLLFLASRETDLSQRISFYDFVPYRYGPFSFAMYNDLRRLSQAGMITTQRLRISADWRQEAESIVFPLPVVVRGCVSDVLRHHGELNDQELIRIVYSRYPWYASRSELVASSRPDTVTQPAVFTVGYEGRSIDALLALLLQRGIQRIVDARLNPFSRKYGFSGKALKKLAGKVGIDYCHFPDVGVPTALRSDLSGPEDYATLFDFYRKRVLREAETAVRTIGELMVQTPTALLCFEADPDKCHRSVLADHLAGRTGLDIVNL